MKPSKTGTFHNFVKNPILLLCTYYQGLSGCVICCFKNPESLDFIGKIYDNEFVFAYYVTSRVSGVKSVLWGKNWGKMWGIKKTMRVRHYYDGPVKNTGRSLEEIERDIQKETEKCDKMNEWENPDQDK